MSTTTAYDLWVMANVTKSSSEVIKLTNDNYIKIANNVGAQNKINITNFELSSNSHGDGSYELYFIFYELGTTTPHGNGQYITSITLTVDTQAPVLTLNGGWSFANGTDDQDGYDQVGITTNVSPGFSFNSTENGIITLSENAPTINNYDMNTPVKTIFFNPLSVGTYENILLTVTDNYGNESLPLLIPTFTVNKINVRIIHNLSVDSQGHGLLNISFDSPVTWLQSPLNNLNDIFKFSRLPNNEMPLSGDIIQHNVLHNYTDDNSDGNVVGALVNPGVNVAASTEPAASIYLFI